MNGNSKPDLAVVAGHFNFAGYTAPRRNLHRFIRYVHSLGVPCYGIELYLPHQEPVTPGYPTWKQIKVGPEHVLWQKEGLWNAAEKLVPPEYQKLLFLDTDVWCPQPRWMRLVSEALEEFYLVHPFSTAYATTADGRCGPPMASVVRGGLEPPMKHHPGYGWGVWRSLFRDAAGFFDASVGGNGDWMLAYAWDKTPVQTLILHNQHRDPVVPPCVMDLYEQWLPGFRRWLPSNVLVGCVEVDLIHEYHGHKRDRQYLTRRSMLHGLQPDELARDEHGLWHWTDKANPLRRRCFENFFANRREDG